MLINKSFVQGDIVSIKLISHEEIVTKFVSDDSTHVTISRPLILNLTVAERSDRPALQMFPFFMLGADEDITVSLRKEHIIAMVKSREDVKNGYIQNTTGLMMPGQENASGIFK